MSAGRNGSKPDLADTERKSASGQHPAVRSYHQKIHAIQEGQMPSVRAVTDRMRESLERARSDRPDPRRDPDSDRPEGSSTEDIPVDVVVLPPRPPVPRPARRPMKSRPGES